MQPFMSKKIAGIYTVNLQRKYDNRPLKDFSDDQLNRRNFVEQLSQVVRTRVNAGKTRIGIYGEPGAGKTSAINLLAHELAGDDAIVFEKFAPWLYTDEVQFFYDLPADRPAARTFDRHCGELGSVCRYFRDRDRINGGGFGGSSRDGIGENTQAINGGHRFGG